MSWLDGKTTFRCSAALALTAWGAGLGCAKPAGPLFPPVVPPLVWPSPPETTRIRLVGSIDGSRDLRAAVSGMEAFKSAIRGPRPPIRFSSPHAIALGPASLIAVTDSNGGAVHLLELNERTHRVVTGWSKERFGTPLGAAWVGDRLFVTDARRHEVIELDANGSFRNRFGRDDLRRPVGIAYVAARDRLYVVDGGAHRIAIFDPQGAFIESFGRRGSASGTFNFPSHICNREDRLLVADSGNARVQILDLDGACLGVIGKMGDAAGDFAFPKGVAFDSEGHIYVVDTRFENIQVFDRNGRLLLAFGEEGRQLGKFSLPAGLAIDEYDRIWVADSANRRIQVFDYLRTEP